MNSIIKKLPRKKLPLMTDFRLRSKLYILMWKKNQQAIFAFGSLRQVTVAFLLIIFITTSLGSYAYASEQVTLGNILYPVKIAIEQVEINIVHSSSTITSKHLKFADRRLNEAKILNSDANQQTANAILLAKTLNKFQSELISTDRNSISSSSTLSDKYLAKVTNLAQEITIDENHVEAITTLASTANYLQHHSKEKIEEQAVRIIQPTSVSTSTTIASTSTVTSTSSLPIEDSNHKKITDTPKQEFARKITRVKKMVKEYETKSSTSSPEKKIKTKKLINELNKEMVKAIQSAQENKIEEAIKITTNTESVIDNAEMFTTTKRVEEKSEIKNEESEKSSGDRKKIEEEKKYESRDSESQRTTSSERR